eukprot:SAG11_NODE_23975_length_380_cov_0.629893_1_plen_70_part_10
MLSLFPAPFLLALLPVLAVAPAICVPGQLSVSEVHNAGARLPLGEDYIEINNLGDQECSQDGSSITRLSP